MHTRAALTELTSRRSEGGRKGLAALYAAAAAANSAALASRPALSDAPRRMSRAELIGSKLPIPFISVGIYSYLATDLLSHRHLQMCIRECRAISKSGMGGSGIENIQNSNTILHLLEVEPLNVGRNFALH